MAAGFGSVTWNIVDALQLAIRTMSPVASVLAGELAATCGAATVLGIAATMPRPAMSVGTRTEMTSLVGSGADADGKRRERPGERRREAAAGAAVALQAGARSTGSRRRRRAGR